MDDRHPIRRRFFLAVGGLAIAGASAYLLFGKDIGIGREHSLLGESCSYCGMRIERKEFAAEMVVDGRRLVYDDVGCMMIHYLSFKGLIQPVQGVWSPSKIEKTTVYNYENGEEIDAFSAWYVKGSDVITPMRHGLIAFKSFISAVEFVKTHGGEVLGWDAAVQSFLSPSHGEHETHEQQNVSEAFRIRLKQLNGQEVTVSEILSWGKPVLLVFFATWCPTCSKNITTLNRVYGQFRGRVVVLLTSFDPSDTLAKIQRFLEQHNASSDWVVTQPNLEFLISLRVITQETIFGITPSGDIVYEKRFGTLTEDDWLKIVEKLS